MFYGQFAVWHDWTPDQVDALPEWYQRLLPTYHAILDQLDRDERDRNRASQQTPGWR